MTLLRNGIEIGPLDLWERNWLHTSEMLARLHSRASCSAQSTYIWVPSEVPVLKEAANIGPECTRAIGDHSSSACSQHPERLEFGGSKQQTVVVALHWRISFAGS